MSFSAPSLRCSVLLAVATSFQVEGATRHWDAGGGNSLWATAANWSNNVAPLPGDALVFPFRSAGTVSITNNFAAGTDFASLTLEDFYIVRGNAVNLTEGVVVLGAAELALNLRQLNGCRVTTLSQNLTLSGDFDLNGFPVLMHAEGDIQVSGAIRGAGPGSQLMKEGAGSLALNGTNTYAGGTTVSQGELSVNGIVPGQVALLNGSWLSGRGVILGSVSTAGDVTITPGGISRAILTVGGALQLNSGATLALSFLGSVPGTGHDQLRCSNTVNLASARLLTLISASLVLPAGGVLVILTNTSANPIVGEFSGKPEGSRFQLGETEVEISYRGGDGNDVTLTGISVARTWTGSAFVNLGSNWTTARNWSASLLPSPEDGLHFPTGALDRTNFCDFTNGFPLHHITLGQSDYVIGGTNELVVRHRLEATNQNGAVEFFPAVRAGLNPTVISNHPGGTLNLRGPIQLSGAAGVFAPRGTIAALGPINASQSTFKRGPGALQLAGTNQFGGSFQIEEGTVQVLDNSALLPPAGSVSVLAGAQLELAGGRIASKPLTLSGTLASTGDGASNVWSGGIAIPAPATMHVAGNSILRIGDFHGSGSVAKTGAGRLILATPGCVNFAGTLFVNEGTVTLPGCVSGGKIVVEAGGTLEGTGSIFMLTNRPGGRLSPGQGAVPGILTVLGPLELNAGSVFHVRINGTMAGSQYAYLETFNSPARLNGATLELSLGFTPPTNVTFLLILRNSGPVTGTFAGLPQNSLLTNNGVVFRISYTGGFGNDVTIRSLGYEAPTNLRVHDGPNTRRVAIRWNAPTLGPAVAEYVVYRNGFEFKRGAPEAFGTLLLAEDLHLLPGHTYTYQVVAVFADGSLSAPSNELTVTALPADPVVGTNQIVTVLLRFADFIEEPFPPSQVDTMMFTATNSVRAYLEEVSYGRLSIEGSTHGWFTLPHPASNYCATLFPNGLWYSCNNLLPDIYSVLPPAVSNLVQAADQVQFAIHGMGTVGEAGGSFAFYSATNGFGPGTILHELGHTFGFLHASTLINCLGYPLGPDLVHMRTNNCFTLLYGDRYDPMGGGDTVHYHAFFKEQAGWLPTNNVRWINADGDYTLHAVERPTNAVQMLKIDLGGEMFWFLEYRTRTGFDGPASPEPPTGGPIDGVLMRVRVSRFILADWDTFWIQPAVRTNAPWFDPFSGLCVNVLSQDGTNATVRVTGLNYAFRLTDAQRLGNDARLTWNAVPGARYLLQGSADFNAWTTLATSVDATNRTMTFTLPGAAAGPFHFFRAAVDTGP